MHNEILKCARLQKFGFLPGHEQRVGFLCFFSLNFARANCLAG